jgi:hypothetical protein
VSVQVRTLPLGRVVSRAGRALGDDQLAVAPTSEGEKLLVLEQHLEPDRAEIRFVGAVGILLTPIMPRPAPQGSPCLFKARRVATNVRRSAAVRGLAATSIGA